MTPRFKPGDRVRIRTDSPPGHIRTPKYVQGKTGEVAGIHGAFRNPETLAYGRDGLPKQFLYLVRFDERDLWQQYRGSPRDTLLVDVYEHWLEPA